MKTVLNVLVCSILCVCAGAPGVKADCQSDFQAIMAAHLKAGPYHVSSKGGVRPYELDVIAPDRFYVKEYDKSGSGALFDEVIFTSKGGWIKQGSAKWESIPDAAVAKALAGYNAALAGGFKNATELDCKGNQAPKELSGGKKVTGYYIFKINLFDMHSGRDVLASAGLMTTEDGRPGALLLRTNKGDEAQDITYDPTIKIELPAR